MAYYRNQIVTILSKRDEYRMDQKAIEVTEAL